MFVEETKEKFQIYLYLNFWASKSSKYVNFRLLSPTDSGRAGPFLGNWNFRPMSVAHQKLDVGLDFGRKFGALELQLDGNLVTRHTRWQR
jgi:hypothetical protein